MNNVVIGQYIPGTSFLHKMDPRSKLLSLFILMISTFVFTEVTHMLVLLGIVLIILKVAGIPVMRIIKGLKPILILLTFTFVFQILFVRTGELMYSIPLNFSVYNLLVAFGIFIFFFYSRQFVKFRFFYFLFTIAGILAFLHYVTLGVPFATPIFNVYTDGLLGAVYIMIRLIIIVTMSTILTLTTKPTDLTLGLEKLLKPFNFGSNLSEEIALIISIALRYIPTLLDEANKIMLAQASRGVDFTEGKVKDKVMQVISLLVPMFIISFKRSDDLANAMEARNFVPGKLRTRLQILKWNYKDTLTMMFSFSVLAVAIVLRIVL